MNTAGTSQNSFSIEISPEREKLVRAAYEKLGYEVEVSRQDEHTDPRLTIRRPESAAPASEATPGRERAARCEEILNRIIGIDREVVRYYLKLVCLVGLIGAVCIGLSFAALKAGSHIVFTVLLLIGIFGCTITLSLRPLFTRMGRKKLGGEEPALIAELQDLLGPEGKGGAEE